MKQALTDKAGAEKEVGDVVARVQKEVQVLKLMKYRGYKDRAQSKALSYPLEIRISHGDQGTSTFLASDAPHSLMPPSRRPILLKTSRPAKFPKILRYSELLKHLIKIL